jgi:hypothetical protein
MSFLLSQDAVHSWPDVTAVDTTLPSDEALENAGPDPDAGPKVKFLYMMSGKRG